MLLVDKSGQGVGLSSVARALSLSQMRYSLSLSAVESGRLRNLCKNSRLLSHVVDLELGEGHLLLAHRRHTAGVLLGRGVRVPSRMESFLVIRQGGLRLGSFESFRLEWDS